jgi:hypothetical protein
MARIQRKAGALLRRLMGTVAAVFSFGVIAQAASADDFDLINAAFDTTQMDPANVETISEEDMGELRGGYRTLAFGLAFFVDATRFDGTEGELPPGVELSQTDGPNNVQISAQFGGSFGFSNSNGVLQLTSVNGNNNVINNTVAINIAVLDDPADIGTIFPFFGPMGN